MLTSTRAPSDLEMRLAAAGTLARLAQIYRDAVPWHEMVKGFPFRGDRILFANRAVGIFKPRQMDRVLSIRTVVPGPVEACSIRTKRRTAARMACGFTTCATSIPPTIRTSG